MADGAAADERLRDLVHFDGRLQAGVNALLFQRILQSQAYLTSIGVATQNRRTDF